MKKFVLTFAVLALGVAGAAEKRSITLFQPTVIGGQELKAGEYRMEIKDNKLSIKDGKRVIEADVRVETEGRKFNTTSVRYLPDNQVREIRIGGTTTKLVLGPAAQNAN